MISSGHLCPSHKIDLRSCPLGSDPDGAESGVADNTVRIRYLLRSTEPAAASAFVGSRSPRRDAVAANNDVILRPRWRWLFHETVEASVTARRRQRIGTAQGKTRSPNRECADGDERFPLIRRTVRRVRRPREPLPSCGTRMETLRHGSFRKIASTVQTIGLAAGRVRHSESRRFPFNTAGDVLDHVAMSGSTCRFAFKPKLGEVLLRFFPAEIPLTNFSEWPRRSCRSSAAFGITMLHRAWLSADIRKRARNNT